MNASLKTKYRAIYEQAFVPIFVKDNIPTDLLLEGCKKARVKFIEYTLRRDDAKEVIPTLKKRYPDLYFTVGSTIDSDKIVEKLSDKYPQLMTFEEIAATGADGFVSMLPMSSETLEKYSKNFIMIPGGSTLGEALRQMNSGAHFVKIMGTLVDVVKSVNSSPAFGFCPVFVTGGVNTETIGKFVDAGAVLFASGFDVILKGIPVEDLTVDIVAERIQVFQKAISEARAKARPELAGLEKLSDEEFFRTIPHYSVF